MRYFYDPSFHNKGWFDETLTVEGWFDEDLTADAPGGGDATFTTVVGTADAAGGSSSFTGTATFDTVVGVATADGGSTAFHGGPWVVSAGTVNSGVGDVTYTIPTHQTDDILLLTVECAETGGVTAPSGWAHITNSPRAQGSNVTTLNVMWARATSGSTTNPTVTDPGNHQIGFVSVIRAAITTGNPWDFTPVGDGGTAATSFSADNGTTTVANTLVLTAIASNFDTLTDQFSSVSMTGVTNFTEHEQSFTDNGNGGGIALYSGELETAGTPGACDGTIGTSSSWSSLVFAIKPAASTTDGTFTTTVGDAPAAGGSTSFTGDATFDTVASTATADGGSSAFTGDGTFDTAAASATADGGSTAFTGGADFSTVVGAATADGGSSSFTGDATFDTVVGTATAEGGVTTFDTAGNADFVTTVGDATADGGSTTFTGTAVFDTVAGEATASGGVTTFEGDQPAAPQGGGHTPNRWIRPTWADPQQPQPSVDATFATLTGTLLAAGGETTFDAETPWPLTVEGYNALVLELV